MIEWTEDQLPAGPALVMFYGANCAPCKALKPLLAEVKDAPVYMVDSAKSVLAGQYRVRSVPVLLSVAKDGFVHDRKDGMQTAGTVNLMVKGVVG